LGPRDAELGECRDLAARDRDCAFALTLDRRRRARAEHTVPPLLLQLHQLEDLEDPAEVPAIEAAWKVECARLQGEGKQKKPKARGKGKGKAAQRDDSDDADDDGEADEADEDVRPVKSKVRAAAKKVPAASRKNKKRKAELSSESQSSEEDVKPPPKRRAPRKGIETGETG
jgi:hypothetical protein